MDYAGGYQGSKRHPLGMGLVVAGHVVVLGAVIVFPPKFIREIPSILTVENIPVEAPPPPEPVETEVQPPEHKVVSRIDTPDPLVDPPVTRTVDIARADPILPPPLPPLPGNDRVVDPPVPVPVLTEAAPDQRYAANFQPPYPPAMARQEIEGAVVVRVLIGADGRVKAVQQVSAADPSFYTATERQALRYWRFRPATRDGIAVESWRTMTVRFRMMA